MLNTVKYNLYRLLKNKLVFGMMLAGIVVGCVGTAIMQRFDSGMFDFSIIIITFVLPTVLKYSCYNAKPHLGECYENCYDGGQ